MKNKNSVILIIRDGWGYNAKTAGNYIAEAQTPNQDYFWQYCPHGLLAASGEAVGLMPGYQGNSEVGHLTLGAGRIIYQSLPKIHQAIKGGEFFSNKALLKVIKHCRQSKTTLHLIGLLQTQGVHSHIHHLLALLDLCHKEKFTDVDIHVITDGRDAPVHESLKHLAVLNKKIKQLGFGRVVTVSGRYYTMDRNKRWERTKQAYDCIVSGIAPEYVEAVKQIKASHAEGKTDEFISPSKLRGYEGIKANDGVIFFNFRTDRTRQLTQAIIEPDFKGFKRKMVKVKFVAMTQFYEPMPASVAFPNVNLKNLLGDVVAKNNLKQLRISETEKYAHVTFFFNGQKEQAHKNEDRILIKSPHVATYDLQPEMSVFKIASRLKKEIKKEQYDLIIVNLVNCDMVGHTADKRAIIKAVESVDKATGEIVNCGLDHGYTSITLADHGNAENKHGIYATSHTINPVPVCIISNNPKLQSIKINKKIGQQDIAPTILKLLGIKKPEEMTGQAIYN